MLLYNNNILFSNFVKCKDGNDPKITKQPASAKWFKNRPAIEGTDYTQAIETDANIGGILNDGFIVIDIDDKKESDQYFNYVKNNNIKTIIVKTDRGRHFYFKYTQKNPQLKNNVNIKTFLGISVDYRIGGIKGYVLIKRFGEYREIENWIEPNQLAELPIYFKKPLFNLNKRTRPNENFKLENAFKMKDGDNRHMYLFNDFNNLLLNNNYTQAEADKIIDFVNYKIFAEPKPPKEIENIKKSHERSPRHNKKNNNFTHADVDSVLNNTNNETSNEETDGADASNEVLTIQTSKQPNNIYPQNEKLTRVEKLDFLAHFLIEKRTIKSEGEFLFYFSDNYYKELTRTQLFHFATLEDINIKSDEIKTLYLKILTYAPTYDNKSKAIALNNAIILYEKGSFRIITDLTEAKNYFCKIKLDIDFKNYENEKIELVDNFFLTLADGDESIKQLLIEIIGYCFYLPYDFKKIFFLIGSGHNGKSSYLNLINGLIGSNYCSSQKALDLEYNRFAPYNLMGKLVNFNAENIKEPFKKCDILKNISGGDYFTIEKKGVQGFSIKLDTKLIFSANIPPHFLEDSDAIKDRLIYIPFNHRFTDKKGNETGDPDIVKKILKYKSYILYISLLAMKEVIKNKGFIKSKSVEKTTLDIIKENDPIYSFLYDYEIKYNKQIYNESYKKIFQMFCEYCKISNIKNVYNKYNFTRNIQRYLTNIEVKNINGNKTYISDDNNFISLLNDDDEEPTNEDNEEHNEEPINNQPIKLTTNCANVDNNADINEDNEDNEDNEILWGEGLNKMTKREWEKIRPKIQEENARQKEYLRSLEEKETRDNNQLTKQATDGADVVKIYNQEEMQEKEFKKALKQERMFNEFLEIKKKIDKKINENRKQPIGDFSDKTEEEIKKLTYKDILTDEKTDSQNINYFLSKNFFYTLDKRFLINFNNKTLYFYKNIEDMSFKECKNFLDNPNYF